MTDRMKDIRARHRRRTQYTAPTQHDHDENWLLGQVDLARQDADGLAAALFDNRAETIELALERHREAVALRSAK